MCLTATRHCGDDSLLGDSGCGPWEVSKKGKKRRRSAGNSFTPFKMLAHFIARCHDRRGLPAFRKWWHDIGYEVFVKSIVGDNETAVVVTPLSHSPCCGPIVGELILSPTLQLKWLDPSMEQWCSGGPSLLSPSDTRCDEVICVLSIDEGSKFLKGRPDADKTYFGELWRDVRQDRAREKQRKKACAPLVKRSAMLEADPIMGLRRHIVNTVARITLLL